MPNIVLLTDSSPLHTPLLSTPPMLHNRVLSIFSANVIMTDFMTSVIHSWGMQHSSWTSFYFSWVHNCLSFVLLLKTIKINICRPLIHLQTLWDTQNLNSIFQHTRYSVFLLRLATWHSVFKHSLTYCRSLLLSYLFNSSNAILATLWPLSHKMSSFLVSRAVSFNSPLYMETPLPLHFPSSPPFNTRPWKLYCYMITGDHTCILLCNHN